MKVGQTRSLAHGLAPFKLEAGLETALTELAQATSSHGGVKCRLQCPVPVLLKDSQAVCTPTGTGLNTVVTQQRVKGT